MKTIEEVFEIDDSQHEMVSVPEWDTKVRVQSCTGEERTKLEALWSGNGKTDNLAVRIELLTSTCKSADGKHAWATREQIVRLLKEKNATPIERLVEAGFRVCAFTDHDVEELAKN